MKRLAQSVSGALRGKRARSAADDPGDSEVDDAPTNYGASGKAAAIGLELLASGGESPKVDIIFVHGLRGSSLNTWSRGEICWPRDLLKDDLPEARVFTFGWDSMIANATSYASQDSLFGHAGTLLEGEVIHRLCLPARYTDCVKKQLPCTDFTPHLILAGSAGSLQTQSVYHFSLEELDIVREGKAHPIIFIAHSLGGLLVKQMIIKSSSYQHHGRHGSLGNPFLHTKGVIFMGTTHRGSDAQTYGQYLATVAKALLRQPNLQLLEVLSRDSAILENQRNEFTTISRDLDVVCFREELPTGAGLIVPEWSAVYDGFNVRAGGIHANHMDMTKFSSLQDTGYKRVLHHARRMTKTSYETSQAQHIETIGPKIINALWFDIMYDREKTIDAAFNQTCDWLLAQGGILDNNESGGNNEFDEDDEVDAGEEFDEYDEVDHTEADEDEKPGAAPVDRLKSWLSSDKESIFWISGKAGSGKSTLMKFLHENIRRLNHDFIDDHTIVATFFFYSYKAKDKRFELQMSREEYTEKTLDDLMYGNDNSDEQWGYSKWIYDGHYELIKLLETFQGNAFVKACVSSRELSTFESRFRDKPRIRVQEHTATGIVHYCETRLKRDALGLKHVNTLSTAIRIKAQGVFLWVHLVVGLIVQHNDEGDDTDKLLELINNLPEQLGGKGGLYWHMILHIPRDKLQHASRMLYIMAEVKVGHAELFQLHCAAEAISTQEALPIPPSSSELQTLWESVTLFMATPHSLEKEALPELQRLQRRLQSHCLGLLETKEENSRFASSWATPESWEHIKSHGISRIKSYRVSFMHSTVRDFLSRDYTQRRLKREAFNTNFTLLNGTLRAFRENSRLFARWLLSRYRWDIFFYLEDDEEDHNMGENHEPMFFRAFQNINTIVGTMRKAIRDSFSDQNITLAAPEIFWIKPIHHENEGKESREDTGKEIDDLSKDVFLECHTYYESRKPRNVGDYRNLGMVLEVTKVLLRNGVVLDAGSL
ncbi:hypothetical protein PG988_007585 [Apiospora saccharicola]